MRVSELTNIRVEDVDLGACKIFIELGKGSKDRYILFPEAFRLILKAHLAANLENRFLFESRQRTKFSARRVQQIVADYAALAELPEHVHPHLLRHKMLTWLTTQGLPDSQIQLISGHASKKSLDVLYLVSIPIPLSRTEKSHSLDRRSAVIDILGGCSLRYRIVFPIRF